MAKILLTGASGFIGKALLEYLNIRGNQVVAISIRGEINQDLNGFDAVIHLAGESLVPGRWTKAKRAKILASRIEGTSKLAKALSIVPQPPKVFLSASAVGFYGDRNEELLTEISGPGGNFLAHVCEAWEAATAPLKTCGTRIVWARFAIVLGRDGGALKQLLIPTKLGMGAILGTGEQWMSFITRSDLIQAIDFILKTKSLSGPVNLCAPTPIQQKDFIATLAIALNTKAFLKIPNWLVHILFGQMGDEMLLASARVIPEKLLRAGFIFTSPNLEQAFKKCL
jgi:hypothetical protein